jgi:hypothetical protein
MMKVSINGKKFAGLLLGCSMCIPLGAAAGPIGATLQTEANAGTAAGGNAGLAVISVLITKNNGLPAPNLGGNGTTLPTGWTLESDFNFPSGGCPVKLASTAQPFTNEGAGVYTIEVVPDGVGCTWEAGVYHYVVSINRNVPSVGRFKGSTLGSIDIP